MRTNRDRVGMRSAVLGPGGTWPLAVMAAAGAAVGLVVMAALLALVLSAPGRVAEARPAGGGHPAVVLPLPRALSGTLADRAAVSELTTGHELLLQAAVIIVAIFTLDWRESSFRFTRRQKKP